MLTEIKLTNFKCFKEETSIPLSRFNLFTGVNGAGKSTALQALLLMRQSIEHNPYTTELILNGSCVSLGSFEDVKNRDVRPIEPIYFEISMNYYKFKISICYCLKSEYDGMSLKIEEILIKQERFLENKVCEKFHLKNTEKQIFKVNGDLKLPRNFYLIKLEPNYKDREQYYKLLKHNVESFVKNQDSILVIFDDKTNEDELDIEKIHFISADRIGPQEFYQKTMLSKFPNVGRNGEFAVNLLNKKAQELVNEDLCLGEDAKTLITQTEAWLGKILNPLNLNVKLLGNTNFLELLIGGFKPSNVGFGYSSILPIIVTGLIAKPNEKIIIENPEIHLHPKAQSALIEFLVKVANTGVQIFIESHSDHILNALRIAVKNKIIKPDDVNILFFTQENKNSKIVKPVIDENGRLDQWVEDFFDESAKSLASLAANQRPRFKAPKAES